MAKHNEIGSVGELIATEFLESKGQSILDRNFRRVYGELDVVSQDKGGIVHFVEVKSVSWGIEYRPEENVHPQKIERLKRIIQTYLAFKRVTVEWQFDVLAVYVNQGNKAAKVRYLENIILS